MENNQQNQKPAPDRKKVLMTMVDAGTEFAVMIALPLIIFLVLRAKLHKQGSVAFTVVGILLALTITVVTIGIKINKIKKDLK